MNKKTYPRVLVRRGISDGCPCRIRDADCLCITVEEVLDFLDGAQQAMDLGGCVDEPEVRP